MKRPPVIPHAAADKPKAGYSIAMMRMLTLRPMTAAHEQTSGRFITRKYDVRTLPAREHENTGRDYSDQRHERQELRGQEETYDGDKEDQQHDQGRAGHPSGDPRAEGDEVGDGRARLARPAEATVRRLSARSARSSS